jgi:phosphopantothenoylcysteine decarboxylase/phosphopantothenate--cysteine ligase
MLKNKNILLIISGGIAAEKIPDLIKKLIKEGCSIKCILTDSGSNFLSLNELKRLTGNDVYQKISFLNKNEKMEHIYLSRQADMIIIAPATANLIAKMANGIADDLASTTLLANDKPIFIAPSMNVMMWQNHATQSNIKKIINNGVICIGPENGFLACGEEGEGRMSEPATIIEKIKLKYSQDIRNNILTKHKIIITSGPTHEAIDPIRYIGNRSSGKQGNAIASILSKKGANVSLISGPISESLPDNVNVIKIETAKEMLNACLSELPCSVFISVAAVSDWYAQNISKHKIKKTESKTINLTLKENPDILYTISNNKNLRPRLVIGFSAETENIISNSQKKLVNKKCDWIIANDVSNGFGKATNRIHIIKKDDVSSWPELEKKEIADKLSLLIIDFLEQDENAN